MPEAPSIENGTIDAIVEDEMKKTCETLEGTPQRTSATEAFPPAPTTPYGREGLFYEYDEEEEGDQPSPDSSPDLTEWDVLHEECCLEGQASTHGNSPVNAKIPEESFNGPWSLAIKKARETAWKLGGIAKEAVTTAGVGSTVATVSKAALVTAAMGATRAADKMGPEAAQHLYTVRQTVGLASREYGPAPGERAEMREAREKARKERERRNDEKKRFPNGTPPPTAAEVSWAQEYARMTSPRPDLDRRDSSASYFTSPYSRHRRASSTYSTSPSSRPSSVIQHRRKSTAAFETPAAPLLANKYTPETPSPLARLHSNQVAEQRQRSRAQSNVSQSAEADTPLPARVSQQQVYEQTGEINFLHKPRFDDSVDTHGSPKAEDSYREDCESTHELVAPSEGSPEERRAWRNERDDMEALGQRFARMPPGGFVGQTAYLQTTTTTAWATASAPIVIPSRRKIHKV
ncbi:hypothetical protein BU16DRAFT_556697 [Lophium mytilinum]|uniref:Uncharacterized protein n=1 Tax=Lophium mytilinum TaxID=390894 RepID=A0A6A6R9S6_9PEZI|nr:hypothetical protein BU16DRAFT_556697 [Lophium mytilinum]